MKHIGNIQKMRTQLNQTVQYHLPVGDELVDMNTLIGSQIKLTYTSEINCIACGRKTKKSFNQGYCYPCFSSLAQCDMCIVKPETCHYFAGTCREPQWGETHCMQDHYVYLANSSGIKVGITRGSQIPMRLKPISPSSRRRKMGMGIDHATFREAMARFPGAVTIIPAPHGDERRGITATAACPVSAERPSLRVWIGGAHV